ncbi:unnamed protein product, partial [Polarella glacialis]
GHIATAAPGMASRPEDEAFLQALQLSAAAAKAHEERLVEAALAASVQATPFRMQAIVVELSDDESEPRV